jgi:tetratricopeptide (TPR) repeat protein
VYKRVLAILEKALWSDVTRWLPETLTNLATLYDEQGKYSDAEPLYRRSLAISYQRILKMSAMDLGPHPPDVVSKLNDLAGLYRDEGNYDEAEPLYKLALAVDEMDCDEQKPNAAIVTALYRDEGNYDEAEPLHKLALAIDEMCCDEQLDILGTTLKNLAEHYLAQSRYAEAELLYQRLVIRDKVLLGPEHPNVATNLENYAVLLRETERVDDAEEMEARAKEIRARSE